MDKFTDYYAVLGVDANASTSVIKAAFKKLALQYHPDIYKGSDAQERMRLLLLAYQTLNNPAARQTYDAHRSEHVSGVAAPRVHINNDSSLASKRSNSPNVTPAARRDRQRHYAFPDLTEGHAVQVNLGDTSYHLSADEARTLQQQGMLRGIAPQATQQTGQDALHPFMCHRCHHSWTPASPHAGLQTQEDICPACKARDWADYLLLRCLHCCAIFESEQIRDEVGSYNYGNGDLCPPYELFPLCPYCGTSGWCPAEDARVDELRAQAARRAALLRLVWLAALLVVVIIVLGVVLVNVVR